MERGSGKVTVRLINGVAVSGHMLRRLAEIAVSGSTRRCRNCSNLTLDRLAAAGLLDYDPANGTYRPTSSGYRLVKDMAS